MRRICICLILVALIAGMVGCGSGTVKYSLTMAVAGGNGTAIDLTNASPYATGTKVSIKAVADAGYEFVNWTAPAGTFTNVSVAQTTFTMPAQNVTITANFALAIRDWYELDAIRNNLSGSYLLMNELDSSTPGYEEVASPTANGGRGWQPIGTGYWDGQQVVGESFEGTFDGQGYKIKDLYINRPDEDSVGLFDSVNVGGVIKDIGVMNAVVIGNQSVGGLVGLNGGTVSNSYFIGNVTGTVTGEQQWSFVGGLVGASNGIVSNSYATGSVTGTGTGNYTFVGGLVGNNYGGTVSNSYATGNVTGIGTSDYTCVSGLVGVNANSGIVSNSYATGSVTGTGTGNYTFVGGLVGDNYGNTVSNSYATGSVTGTGTSNYTCVGGLVGFNNAGTVSNSYSTGSVTGTEASNTVCVGGLVGYNNAGNVNNSYSTGSVTDNYVVGGLVGYNNDGNVNNSFWDKETSGQTTSAGGMGKTTEEMQNIDTFSGAAWNITAVAFDETNLAYIWNIVNGVTYPFLGWQ
jgi:uncharacterized repeat protein (TIGR02543 family)